MKFDWRRFSLAALLVFLPIAAQAQAITNKTTSAQFCVDRTVTPWVIGHARKDGKCVGELTQDPTTGTISIAPGINGSGLTGITSSQVGALSPTGNGSGLTGITPSQVGALSPTGDGSQVTTSLFGGVARPAAAWAADRVNAKYYGAIGDGNSHPLGGKFATLAAAQAVYPFVTSLSQELDYAGIQAAINVAVNQANVAAFGIKPIVWIPPSTGCYLIKTGLSASVGATGNGTSNILFDVPGSCIRSSGLAGNAFAIDGGSGAQRFDIELRGLTMYGDATANSTGLNIKNVAYAKFDKVHVEGYTYGGSSTDVDQSLFLASEFIFNTHGFTANQAVNNTGPNSLTFVSTQIGTNAQTGLTLNSGFVLTYIGGSIQYNGAASSSGNDTTQYGVGITGAQYGNAVFSGVDMEGNGGIAGVYVSNTSGVPASVAFINNTFLRFGSRHSQYNVYAAGGTAVKLSFSGGNHFSSLASAAGNGSSVPYTPSASTPDISNTSTGGPTFDDGSSTYKDAVEAPPWAPGANIPVAISGGTGSLKYTPVVTCSGGTSLGAYTATGSSLVVQKTVTTSITINITNLGNCTGPLVASIYPTHQLQQEPGLNGLTLGVGQDGNSGTPVTFFALYGAGLEFQVTPATHTYNGSVTYEIQ